MQVLDGRTMARRKNIADMIVARMTSEKERMTAQYAESRGARTAVRKLILKCVVENEHVYERDENR